MNNILPLLSFLAGVSLGLFYGVLFTLLSKRSPADRLERWIDSIEEKVLHG